MKKQIFMSIVIVVVTNFLFASSPDTDSSFFDTTSSLKQNRLNVVRIGDGNELDSSDYDFRRLRSEAAVGTGIYFAGLALNYTLIGVIAGTDLSDEGIIGLSLAVLASHGLKFAGVPVACVRSSKADDICKGKKSCPTNISWPFYYFGWLCEAVATFIALPALLNENIGLGIAAISIAGVRDIVWGVACVSSIVHVRKIERITKPAKLSFYPMVSFNGRTGLGFTCRF